MTTPNVSQSDLEAAIERVRARVAKHQVAAVWMTTARTTDLALLLEAVENLRAEARDHWNLYVSNVWFKRALEEARRTRAQDEETIQQQRETMREFQGALEEARQEIADWKESAVNEHQNAQVYKQRAEQAESRASSLEAKLERYRSALERIADPAGVEEFSRMTSGRFSIAGIAALARLALEASEES